MVNDKAFLVTEGTPIAMFELKGFKQSAAGTVAAPKKVAPPDEKTLSNSEWSIWGDDNKYPQTIIDTVAENGALQQALSIKRDAHLGKGLVVYTEKISPEGDVHDYKLISDSKIDDFFAYSNLDERYFSLVDGHWLHFNYYPELLPSKDGKKIAAINFRDPATCRVAKRTATGKIEKLFLSYNWPHPDTNEYSTIPALDINNPLLDLEKTDLRGKTFYLPVLFNTRGRAHYNECYWHGLLNGWLSIGNSVPTAVKQLIKNQMVLKFHVQINYGYWEKKYKNWATLADKDRELRISETLELMNTFLRDVDNYGKSLISFFEYDAMSAKDIREDIKISPLKNQLEDLKYITEFQTAANGEILFGVGSDGTLIGQHHPGGSESGSGSNKREAMWVLHQMLEPHRRLTINPWWNLVKQFNKWPLEWKLGVRKMDTSTTQNEDKSKNNEAI